MQQPGVSRRIGAATALLAAAQGWAVAVEANVLRLFEQVDIKLGTLTRLVNNAGVVDVATRVDAMSVGRLERQWRTNVLGSGASYTTGALLDVTGGR
jgi:NAD(P)-dependent dehydrogenase (short-subunit alcohol dehydrogenase family)